MHLQIGNNMGNYGFFTPPPDVKEMRGD